MLLSFCSKCLGKFFKTLVLNEVQACVQVAADQILDEFNCIEKLIEKEEFRLFTAR